MSNIVVLPCESETPSRLQHLLGDWILLLVFLTFLARFETFTRHVVLRILTHPFVFFRAVLGKFNAVILPR